MKTAPLLHPHAHPSIPYWNSVFSWQMFVLPTKRGHISWNAALHGDAIGRAGTKPSLAIVYSGNCFDASYANFCIGVKLWKEEGLCCTLVMAGSRVMGHNMLTRHHPQWPFHIWSVASPGQLEAVGGETKLYQTQPGGKSWLYSKLLKPCHKLLGLEFFPEWGGSVANSFFSMKKMDAW